jgi:hypothetical protein
MIRFLLVAALLVPGVVDMNDQHPSVFSVTVPEAGIYRMHAPLLADGVGQ